MAGMLRPRHARSTEIAAGVSRRGAMAPGCSGASARPCDRRPSGERVHGSGRSRSPDQRGWKWPRRRVIAAIGSVAALTASTAYIETIKETVKRAYNAVAGPPPSPAPAPSSAPIPPQVPECPPLRLDVGPIERSGSHCGQNSFISVAFDGDRPPSGWQWWIFGRAETGGKWFPSSQPSWDGWSRYEADVFTGGDPRYWVHILALNEQAAGAVRQYIVDRDGDGRGKQGDGQWAMGMNLDLVAGCKIHRAKALFPGPCPEATPTGAAPLQGYVAAGTRRPGTRPSPSRPAQNAEK